MDVREIFHGSEEYKAEVQLRDEVLRKPLGLRFSAEDLEAEKTNRHFGLFEGQELLATLQFVKIADEDLKMRQVAVSPSRQGEGLGKLLVAWSESWALTHGFQQIRLHAREGAVKFYLRMGYEVVGDEFFEVGLPHRLMQKRLEIDDKRRR